MISGTQTSYGFDLRTCVFHLSLVSSAPTSDTEPTTIFLPEYHFPRDQVNVEVSGGKWEISTDDEERAWIQKFRWWHGEGKHDLKITGLVRPHNNLNGSAEEAGYLEQCQASYGIDVGKCALM